MNKTKYKDINNNYCRIFRTHGEGKIDINKISKLGKNVIFENSVKIFHPENIEIGNNVYVGHGTILKAYFKNKLIIGNNVWIGQYAFIHAGGGVLIEDGVGIGPYVKLLTQEHLLTKRDIPILYQKQKYSSITLQYGCDLGIGTIVLPGVMIGKNSVIGAGAVVCDNITEYSIAVGIPAKIIKKR